MPSYTMKNTVTDEVTEIFCSLSERDKFLIDNPTFTQTLSSPLIVSGVTSALRRTDDGWKEVLGRVKDGSGRGNTVNT